MPLPIKRRSALKKTLGATVIALATPHIARAALRPVRIGHNNIDDSHYGKGAIAFAKAVAADPMIGTRIKVEVHGNAELGDELSMLKGCIAGTIDMVLCSNSVFGNVDARLGVVNAPFMFQGLKHARSALDGPAGATLSRIALTKGIHVVAWGENGLRQITANKPVRTPQDLHGLKIRVPQSDVMLGGFRALGADPAPLAFGLLPEALRTGQFDAQENAIVVIKAAKLYQQQKYLSLTGHIYDAALFIASPDLVEDLDDQACAALAACAKTGASVTRQVVDAADRDGIAQLKAAGMTIIEDVDVIAFRSAAQPYLQILSEKFGAELVAQLHTAST